MVSDAASYKLRMLQGKSTSEQSINIAGSVSSLSDMSFWTAPSQAFNSKLGQLNLTNDAKLENISADSTPQNQRLFAALTPQAEEHWQQGADPTGYERAMKPLQKTDIAKNRAQVIIDHQKRTLDRPKLPSGGSIALMRAASDLRQFFRDAPDFISILPINDNLVCPS